MPALLERVEQRPVVDAARDRERAGELRERGRQRALVAGLARDAAGERHRARELAGHVQDLAAHVLHVEEGGAQVVGLGLQRAPLDQRRAVRVLGLGHLTGRVDHGRRRRRSGGLRGAQRLARRGLRGGGFALFVSLAGDLGVERLVLSR